MIKQFRVAHKNIFAKSPQLIQCSFLMMILSLTLMLGANLVDAMEDPNPFVKVEEETAEPEMPVEEVVIPEVVEVATIEYAGEMILQEADNLEEEEEVYEPIEPEVTAEDSEAAVVNDEENIQTVVSEEADVILTSISEIGLSQVGYVPDIDNHTKYHSDLGVEMGQDWCGYFVQWCMIQAGRYDLIPENPGNSFSWSQNAVPADGSYIPKAGDVVYFERGHVGIVTGYHDGIVYTVEGNTYVPGHDIYGVWTREYSLTDCTSFLVS